MADMKVQEYEDVQDDLSHEQRGNVINQEAKRILRMQREREDLENKRALEQAEREEKRKIAQLKKSRFQVGAENAARNAAKNVGRSFGGFVQGLMQPAPQQQARRPIRQTGRAAARRQPQQPADLLGLGLLGGGSGGMGLTSPYSTPQARRQNAPSTWGTMASPIAPAAAAPARRQSSRKGRSSAMRLSKGRTLRIKII